MARPNGLTKGEITRTEYLQLLGLHLLGRRHREKLDELEHAIAEIIGDESEYTDFASGLLFEGRPDAVDHELRELEIAVVDDPEAPTDA